RHQGRHDQDERIQSDRAQGRAGHRHQDGVRYRQRQVPSVHRSAPRQRRQGKARCRKGDAGRRVAEDGLLRRRCSGQIAEIALPAVSGAGCSTTPLKGGLMKDVRIEARSRSRRAVVSLAIGASLAVTLGVSAADSDWWGRSPGGSYQIETISTPKDYVT